MDGEQTIGDALRAAALTSEGAADDLEGPELPFEAQHVWNMFLELSAARSSSGFGPNPLSYSEIEAYSRLKEIDLTQGEISLIRTCDSAFMEQYAENTGKNPPRTPPDRREQDG